MLCVTEAAVIVAVLWEDFSPYLVCFASRLPVASLCHCNQHCQGSYQEEGGEIAHDADFISWCQLWGLSAGHGKRRYFLYGLGICFGRAFAHSKASCVKMGAHKALLRGASISTRAEGCLRNAWFSVRAVLIGCVKCIQRGGGVDQKSLKFCAGT